MSKSTASINALINRTPDPVLRSALIAMALELDRLATIVDPAPVVPKKTASARISAPPNIDVFEFDVSNGRNLILTWEAPTTEILLYELRYGTDWDTATFILKTGTLQAVLDPLALGSHTYLLKAINSDGIYSIEAAEVSGVIPAIGSTNITSQSLANNLLLYWTEPTSTWNIDYYRVEREGVLLGNVKGTFKGHTDLVGGEIEFSVTPYDIAGNAGPEVTVVVDIDFPPDFVLVYSFESLLSGTKTACKLIDDYLLCGVNITETYEAHFTSRVWATPQAQVDAGYPIYIQPVPTSGTYKETFDIGTIYTNTIVGLSYATTIVTGSFTIGFSTRVSDDNVVWSSPVSGTNNFFASVRYIEVTMTFTGSADTALMQFYNFQVSASVREEIDSGDIAAISSDANGTVVTFNKDFKDVNSITVSVKTTTEQFFPIYRFSDVPNPTTFSVFVYDSSGIRVSKTVSWKARGVV